MAQQFKSNNNVIYSCKYHVVWCPKYRRKVLVNGVDTRLKEILQEVVSETTGEILEIEVMPDHVHVFIKSSPVHAPHYIVQQLKGYTSHALRQEFPGLKTRLPTLWTRSYYCESVGHLSQEVVRRYIAEQKSK